MNYHQLTENERDQIYMLKREGYKGVEIARSLKRSPSTISRELRRNAGTAAMAAPVTRAAVARTATAAPAEDGTRYKVVGVIENSDHEVEASTGECMPALTSYGEQMPFPESVAVENYLLKIWRFPAMHTLWTKDFHIVLDYPDGLYPSAIAMAADHDFRLKDYLSPDTDLMELAFRIHGNPIDQLLITLKPVEGGGAACSAD